MIQAKGLLLAASLLTIVTAHPAKAAEDITTVATEAGVDPTDLEGAVNSTQLEPREYLQAVGEIARPVPVRTVPTGRLACIARVESHNDPDARNPRSGAAGLFQFLLSTWMTTPQGKAGLSRYDPVAATDAAQWMVNQGRIREWQAVTMGYC